MSQGVRNIFIAWCGIVSSVLTAVALWWIERRANFAFSSFTFMFIIPVGALVVGTPAALGYYLGGRFCNLRPSGALLIYMMPVAAGMYFLNVYLDFRLLEIDGARIADRVSFLTYWQLKTTHTELEVGMKVGGQMIQNKVELGRWGYAQALLQIGGYWFAAAVAGLILIGKNYCEECGRYYRLEGTISRYGIALSSVAVLEKMSGLIRRKKFRDALAAHDREGGSTRFDKSADDLRVDLSLESCPDCGRQHMSMRVFKFEISETTRGKRGSWSEARELAVEATADLDAVDAPPSRDGREPSELR